MIVRILGEGQFEVPDAELSGLNELDAALVDDLDQNDAEGWQEHLTALLARVRSVSTPVADDFLGESDLLLPGPDSTLDEVRELLGEEGLIPG
jgi:PspAA-like protein